MDELRESFCDLSWVGEERSVMPQPAIMTIRPLGNSLRPRVSELVLHRVRTLRARFEACFCDSLYGVVGKEVTDLS